LAYGSAVVTNSVRDGFAGIRVLNERGKAGSREF